MKNDVMTLSRRKGKQSHVKVRRQKILDAALEVFSTKGFVEANIVEVAQKVGVTDRTIFNYFPSKRDLLIAVVKSILTTEPVIDLLKNPPSMDEPSLFSLVLQDRLKVAFDNTDILTRLMPEILRDPELCKMCMEQFEKPLLEIVSKHLESEIAKGTIRQLDTKLVARVLRGMAIGLGILYRMERIDGVMQKIPLQELATEVTQILLKGIQKD